MDFEEINEQSNFRLEEDNFSSLRLCTSRRQVLNDSFWKATVSVAAVRFCFLSPENALAVATLTDPKSIATTSTMTPSSSSSDLNFNVFVPQYKTADDIPPDYYTDHKSIYAFVERIIDGDTFRVRHVPGYGLINDIPEPLQQRGISKDTISIRIYGVDTPEVGKNKRQTTQPFGDVAKQFTTELIYNKMVKITFLRKDQYGRAVAVVETLGLGGSMSICAFISCIGSIDLSMALASAGLAELYTGGGAEYNGNRAELERRIAEAKRRSLGIWSLGENRISAAEQKRINKAEAAGVPMSSTNKAGVMNVTGTKKATMTAFGWNHPMPRTQQVTTEQLRSVAPDTKKHHSGNLCRGEKLIDTAITGLEVVA